MNSNAWVDARLQSPKDFLNFGSKFVYKNCQLHLKIHWILTWYIVWPAGWLLYCGIWQDLLSRMIANANILHNFPHSRKYKYLVASEFLLCTISSVNLLSSNKFPLFQFLAVCFFSLGPPLWWSWSKECSKCTLWAPPRHSFLNSLTVQVLDLIQGQLSALC